MTVAAYLQDKASVDVALANICVEVWTLDETQEELVHDLQVRPGKLEDRLVLLRVERVAGGVDLRRNGPE